MDEKLSQKCLGCGKVKALSSFSKSPFTETNYEYYCKKCRKKTVNSKEDFIEYLKEHEIFFNKDCWDYSFKYMKNKQLKMVKGKEEDLPEDFEKQFLHKIVGKYSSLMNLEGKWKAVQLANENENKNRKNIKVDKEMIYKWGHCTPEEYDFLENEYLKLITGYECDSPAQEILFEEIARTRLDIRRAREKNQSVDKLVKSLQELLGSANIKPVQESGANANEQATFGVLIKKWENEKPIPEPLPEFKDVDGIKKYIEVWFLGHLCRMLNIKNTYSLLYEQEMNKYKVEAPSEYKEEEGA